MADLLTSSQQDDRIAGIPDNWKNVHRISLSQENLLSGNFLPTMNSNDHLLDQEPFIKFHTDADMNDVVNLSGFKMEQHTKTLHSKDQDHHLTWKLLQDSNVEIPLQEFVNKHKNSPQGSVEEFLTKTQKGNIKYNYIENQKILPGLLKQENNPIQWNLDTENFLSDKLDGTVEGINEATFYAGSKYAMFPFHCEDSDLRSVNIHLGGAPKVFCIFMSNKPFIAVLDLDRN